MSNAGIENKFIQGFANPEKRERFMLFLSKPKTRNKFTSALAHFKDLNLNLFERLNKSERHIILERARHLSGQNLCYLISENAELDGKTLPIEDALDETLGSGYGTIILFGDVEMVYYESEDERLLSK
jgi:hypothetical protein